MKIANPHLKMGLKNYKFKKIVSFFVVVALILAVFFIFKSQRWGPFSGWEKITKPEQNIADLLIEQIERRIFTPGPLKSAENALQPFLSRGGVIKWTNLQREQYGLVPLKENSELDSSAELKVADMFDQQYFEHISPSGIGVDGLAQKTGYEYILIGENLAMGNFENSEKLVEAWMNSPGHKENILNSKYREIGIAVMESFYEGEKIWMAVQHFGLPMSSCPKPNQNLKAEIESGQSQIEQIKSGLDALYTKLRSQKSKTKEEIDEYNQMVEEYNSILSQYNLGVEEIKNLINNYNSQVNLFNQCLLETR